MKLKAIVDKNLRDQSRSLSWLAGEMNKTFDGLKLSLLKGSIKYTDLIKMANILQVPVASFFEEDILDNVLAEDIVEYTSLKSQLDSCKELSATLKSQLTDKEKIIELLSKNS